MEVVNWKECTPTIAHGYGIDYKLLKGQADYDPQVSNFCMKGMLYLAYAMLQPGKSYEPHSHSDHEEVYFIISGQGKMRINEETRQIRDGDAIYIPLGATHSISNTGDEFLVFLAFSAQI